MMLAAFDPQPVAARPSRGGGSRASNCQRRLAPAEVLFHAGDLREQVYRVERGSLCHYSRHEDGDHEIIEFLFPGDIIGFGYLGTHASTAQAVTETMLSQVSNEELELLAEADGQLAARMAATADREFEYLRQRALNSASKPAKRVASFLASMARLSTHEGREASVVSEDISSGAVAHHLNMSIDALTDVLRELQKRGMVEPAKDGLRIADVDALEKFADAA
jgi:CRP/FNR family transcriptional regulator